MKKINFLTIIIAVACLVSLNSCEKYQDGPLISFRSKTERVSNTWTGASLSGTPIGFTLTAGGGATLTISGTSASGTWVFQNNNDNIYMTFNLSQLVYPYGDTTETVTFNCNILELKQNNMELKGTCNETVNPPDPYNPNSNLLFNWTLTGKN